MTETPRIFIGIPHREISLENSESLLLFIDEIRKKYRVIVYETYNKKRDEARENIVEEFLKTDADYLLFLDDDHSGHTYEMFEALLNGNAYICALKCFARYYPFQFTLYSFDPEYQDNYGYINVNDKKGYSKCRMVGFGMTLIKRSLFEFIDKPYFKCDDLGEKEDNYFCDKILKSGLDIIGCFDYTLPHQGIDDKNISQKRKDGFREFAVRNNRKTLLNNYINYANKHNKSLSKFQKDRLILLQIELENESIDKNINEINNQVFFERSFKNANICI